MNLEDIAKEAGVSRSTVSRVINNDINVSRKTRQRVLAVIEKHRFVPNHAARTLVTQRSNIVGVVVPHTANVFFGDNSYFPMLLQGIAEATNQHDQSMLLWLAQPDESPEHFARRIVRNRVYDGLIIASIADSDPLIDNLYEINAQFVMVERPLQREESISYVAIDNVYAGRLATEHLIALGYERIAHITGSLTIGDGVDRLTGYQQALQHAGRPYRPELVSAASFTAETGYRAMRELLPHHPDAVFIASDTSAMGALQALHEAGLRVPQDVAIIGFDDIDIATRVTPQLTTVRQPVQEKGSEALSLLLNILDQPESAPRRVILPTQLVIRDSCGAKLRYPSQYEGGTIQQKI
ncbi:MAG: LacI family DNA-binding transcriptional regulator [Anaerolineae bacterium]